MLKIENICEKLSDCIAEELNLDDDKRAVVNYGIFAFIQMGICIALVIIFGFIFNVTIEALLVSIVISILRKNSGGAHAPSPSSCAIIGTVVSVGIGLILKNIDIKLSIFFLAVIVAFTWAYYLIFKLAPVDSPAKPINSVEKRLNLKKKSIKVLNFYVAIVMLNIIFYIIVKNDVLLTYSLCICSGVLWQAFTLTKSGHYFYESLNRFF